MCVILSHWVCADLLCGNRQLIHRSALASLQYGGLWVIRPLLSGSGLQVQGSQSNKKPSRIQREGTQRSMPSSYVEEQEGREILLWLFRENSLTQPALGHNNSHLSHVQNTLTRLQDPESLTHHGVHAQTWGAGSSPVNQCRWVLGEGGILQGLHPGGCSPCLGSASESYFLFHKKTEFATKQLSQPASFL